MHILSQLNFSCQRVYFRFLCLGTQAGGGVADLSMKGFVKSKKKKNIVSGNEDQKMHRGKG